MEDATIVSLYWQRSESAIEETARKYGAYCRAIARNVLHCDADEEECVNDTYLGAWNAMPPQRPVILRAFLGKIARNLALGRLDYNSARKRGGAVTVILEELEECLAAPGMGVEETYEAKETVKAINGFLHGLNPIERIVFLRRYWYLDSIREVADRLGMSESKVKSMLFRTRKRLQEYLKREGIIV